MRMILYISDRPTPWKTRWMRMNGVVIIEQFSVLGNLKITGECIFSVYAVFSEKKLFREGATCLLLQFAAFLANHGFSSHYRLKKYWIKLHIVSFLFVCLWNPFAYLHYIQHCTNELPLNLLNYFYLWLSSQWCPNESWQSTLIMAILPIFCVKWLVRQVGFSGSEQKNLRTEFTILKRIELGSDSLLCHESQWIPGKFINMY